MTKGGVRWSGCVIWMVGCACARPETQNAAALTLREWLRMPIACSMDRIAARGWQRPRSCFHRVDLVAGMAQDGSQDPIPAAHASRHDLCPSRHDPNLHLQLLIKLRAGPRLLETGVKRRNPTSSRGSSPHSQRASALNRSDIALNAAGQRHLL